MVVEKDLGRNLRGENVEGLAVGRCSKKVPRENGGRLRLIIIFGALPDSGNVRVTSGSLKKI